MRETVLLVVRVYAVPQGLWSDYPTLAVITTAMTGTTAIPGM